MPATVKIVPDHDQEVPVTLKKKAVRTHTRAKDKDAASIASTRRIPSTSSSR